VTVLAGIAGLGIACTACTASQAQSVNTTTTSRPVYLTTTTVAYKPQYVMAGGHEVLVPVELDHEPVNSYSSTGQNIIYTAGGLAPSKLYASGKAPIVFTNLTNSAIVVQFYNWPNYPKPFTVKAGGSYSIHYNGLIALGYGLVHGSDHAFLYIDDLPGVDSPP
jgi:hypothetical protein